MIVASRIEKNMIFYSNEYTVLKKERKILHYLNLNSLKMNDLLLGHGSTRGISSNTVCRALNLFNLLYLINWRHFSWKKLIFEEVAPKKWKFLISGGHFRPKFIKMSATSSKINFFQEKCFQFIRYNKLKRFRALQTVFEDMPLVLPCPIGRGSFLAVGMKFSITLCKQHFCKNRLFFA